MENTIRKITSRDIIQKVPRGEKVGDRERYREERRRYSPAEKTSYSAASTRAREETCSIVCLNSRYNLYTTGYHKLNKIDINA